MWLRVSSALSLVGTPVWAAQGRWVRANTPVIPEAGGPQHGVVAGPEPMDRILVIGESPAAGVGADNHEEALVGHFARRWASLRTRGVRWRVVARNGTTAVRARRELLPRVPIAPVDLVAIVLGVNDTMRLTPVPLWRHHVDRLFTEVRERVGHAPIVVSAVPPMERFPALPAPLRQVLGLRARLLDTHLRQLCADRPAICHVGGLIDGISDEMFCADRFHPNPDGYAAWAGRMAEIAHARF